MSSKAQVSGKILAFIIAMIILLFFLLIWSGIAGKILEFFAEKLRLEIIVHRE